jgi:hypothetical protein
MRTGVCIRRHYTLGMSDVSRPATIQSAQPRWSHRDPVEGEPWFPDGSPEAAAWADATKTARDRLQDMDAAIARTADITTDPVVYRAQLFDLAAGRFTIWAERGLAAVSTEDGCRDYERWLDRYVTNWLTYVAETCPNVNALDELQHRLRELAGRRLREARHALGRRSAAE